MNQMVSVEISGRYAACAMAVELNRLISISGRSFLNVGWGQSHHRTGLERPTIFQSKGV